VTTTVRDPFIGTLVDGRYEVVSRVARGGMATVYLATDRRLERQVALKIMHPHLAEGVQGAAFVSRFRREARAAARLTHQGLVGVYDQGLDGDTSYLTMEYVDGTNLRHRLHEPPAVTVGEAFAVADAVLDALAAVHRENLVHRDIKPENVLLAKDGRVKVADFGLARAVTEVTAATTGTVLGTVAYLSPELITTGSCDARTDIYAVGVMLYEMLAGRQPFAGATPIQVAMSHVNETMGPPSASAPWLPSEVDDLVAALTSRDPDDRPRDAGVALAELRRVRRLLPADVAERAAVVVVPAGEQDSDADDTAARSLDAAPLSPTAVLRPGTGETSTVPEAPVAEDAAGPGTGTGTEHTVALPVQQTQRLSGTEALAAAVGLGTEAADDGPAPARGSRRGRRLVLALVAVVVLVGLTVGGLAWYQKAGPGAYTVVPTGVVGAAEAEATDRLTAADLETTTSQEFSDTVAEGDVVSTDPGTGDRVRKGSTVTVVVSAGVKTYTVPKRLVGRPAAKATSLLGSAGFTVGDPRSEYSDDAPEGQVLATSVPEGSTQRHDTVVTLTVSQGPAPVTVPDVRNLTRGDAADKLDEDALGLEVSGKEYDSTVPKGQIVSQEPAAGSQGHRTDTVSVVISRGPELVLVPDVVRMDDGAAESRLRGLGFQVKINRYLGGLLHTVRFQDVEGGTKAPKGTTITLTVW